MAKVWIVAGAMDYEGADFEHSCDAFFDYQDAVNYGEKLTNSSNEYDSYVIKEVEVK